MPRWPTEKDQEEDQVRIEIPDLPEATGVTPVPPAGEAPGQLGQLCARLGQLGALLSEANQQVLAYLIEQQTRSSGPATGDRAAAALSELSEKIDCLGEQVGQLDARLETLIDRLAADAEGGRRPVGTGPGDAVGGRRQAESGEGSISLPSAPSPFPLPPSAFPSPPSAFRLPPSPFSRQQLLADVTQGDPGACALLGQLLIFRSAAADKMPPLLKEIGEAYYRWQPKTRPGPSPMEKALAVWLKEALQEVGIANSIELVEPGERFDSTRHNASTRGVEIIEVRGWIVLRDNGKVYTKANVAVR